MTAAICVPWRGGDPTREDAWARVQSQGFPYPMFTGDSDPEKPFNRAAARNAAAAAAGDVDVYVFQDADHALFHHRTRAAVYLADKEVIAVHPYTQVVVEDLATGDQWPTFFSPAHTSGNIAVPRALWEASGGWDERLNEWGYEDVAFSRVLLQLGGQLGYVPGPVLVFEHTRTDDMRAETAPVPLLMGRYFAIDDKQKALAMAEEVRVARLR